MISSEKGYTKASPIAGGRPSGGPSSTTPGWRSCPLPTLPQGNRGARQQSWGSCIASGSIGRRLRISKSIWTSRGRSVGMSCSIRGMARGESRWFATSENIPLTIWTQATATLPCLAFVLSPVWRVRILSRHGSISSDTPMLPRCGRTFRPVLPLHLTDPNPLARLRRPRSDPRLLRHARHLLTRFPRSAREHLRSRAADRTAPPRRLRFVRTSQRVRFCSSPTYLFRRRKNT